LAVLQLPVKKKFNASVNGRISWLIISKNNP